MYEEYILSAISPSKKGKLPSKVINFTEGVEIPQGSIPRFEMFRGAEGDVIVNMNHYTGIEDLGDKIAVKAGTTWREVSEKYNVELHGNLNLTVGGTLFFGDPVYGLNEFGSMTAKVEVEGFNGTLYQGKYNGGIPLKVFIKKENKKITWREWRGNTSSLFSMVRSWYNNTIPVFRDISVVKDNEGVKVVASYPETREILLKPFLNSSSPGNPFYDKIDSPFYYEGEIPLDSLFSLEAAIEMAEFAVIRVRKDKAVYSISSNNKLLGIPNVKFSIEESIFNGCILCGSCVNVCPHGKQRGNDVSFTPLGLYVLQSDGMADQVSNCHVCGQCISVCPAKLDIITDLRKFVNPTLPQQSPRPPLNDLRKRINVVLTPISAELYDYALRSIEYLSRLGLDVGFIYLNVNPNSLIRGNPDLDFLMNELVGIEELITITPEDHYYLQILKARRVIQIDFIGTMLLEKNPDAVKGKSLHVPCLLKSEPKTDDDKKIHDCSTFFLNKVNREGMRADLKADVTLCPLTSKGLGIPSVLDLSLPQIPDLIETFKQIKDKVEKGTENTQIILDDLSWFEGINDTVLQSIQEEAISKGFSDVPYITLKLLYIYTPSLPYELRDSKLIEKMKSVILNAQT
ncbi:4Fe-4S dicluster domain-containing protein [Sulfuracidifex tepidarius]|uniref:4Fe-4S ferredoxin-type domain-containing protein n=1 Tax=Sulfuracidifex tepidarius TaxID=1294262 RepID=A0A510E607_9CREN|nr:4Fe-4S dicluster domain-containing protein [Sulfuracidifex tepidarius]BBG24690.1 hypothetical protein IC006_2024 [Sulfuracidifex tepidarius]BBG27478.1 hypothetical protein IC007_2032 [Sulfuracidifex tepidarius]